MKKSEFELTGNPFSDTGLYVLSDLAGVETPEDLTLEAIRSIYGDGTELAKINARLRSFTLVFGSNGPLTQSQYRPKFPKGSQKKLSLKNIKAYTGVLSAFLREMQQQHTDYPLCEICGRNFTFDFDTTVRQAFAEADILDDKEKRIGREWFPLAGSLGNDAQALPAASRGLCVCAKCLFVVHYMPLGMMLFDKKLVCFQSNFPRIARELTAELVHEYQERLTVRTNESTDEKVETKGKGDKTATLVKHLLTWMEKRQTVIKEEKLSGSVTLTAWLFNNGKDADCQIVEIPNHVLQFLWSARKSGYKDELLSLLFGDGKLKPYEQLFACIQESRDYLRLYPQGTFLGASSGLFALYHQLILGESVTALRSAQNVAKVRLAMATPKDLKSLKKAGKIEAEQYKRLRRLMLDMAKTGSFEAIAYHALFPTIHRHPIRIDFRGWRTIQYYLAHPDDDVLDFQPQPTHDGGAMKPHAKISEAAKLYFDDFVARKGIERFEREIIDGFTRTNPNGVQWLRVVFIRLAKNYPGFTIQDWDEFVQDENGQPQANELLFQMRLELANLYREFAHTQIQTH